ncbi:general odorant-binding protein 57e [Drosophila eugracilis]|uniref:general odorant-binding protein 57e n=1 Tax=Drosophila eugracilis TaxID=29029 RepID=UPI0007E77788|nr:general odorant-binding protein 57e [Drosophila eugracilis]
MLDRQALYLILLLSCGTVHGNSAVYNPCIKYMKLTEDEATQVLNHWPDRKDPSFDDRGYRCFLTCVLIDMGLISPSGQVQIDKYMKSGVVDWRYVAMELVWCRGDFEDEKDLCELAFGIFNCFREVKLGVANKRDK